MRKAVLATLSVVAVAHVVRPRLRWVLRVDAPNGESPVGCLFAENVWHAPLRVCGPAQFRFKADGGPESVVADPMKFIRGRYNYPCTTVIPTLASDFVLKQGERTPAVFFHRRSPLDEEAFADMILSHWMSWDAEMHVPVQPFWPLPLRMTVKVKAGDVNVILGTHKSSNEGMHHKRGEPTACDVGLIDSHRMNLQEPIRAEKLPRRRFNACSRHP
jgi:hypothetical protein